ncbi:hypothetical protein [Nonomuraea angiospora]
MRNVAASPPPDVPSTSREGYVPGFIGLIRPDGTVVRVADDIAPRPTAVR